jgi:menaquinone-dependent protoporphyrinogen oxidase
MRNLSDEQKGQKEDVEMQTTDKEIRGMDRRDFLLLSAGAMCASILCRGRAIAANGGSGVESSESSRQKDSGTADKVLIAYATRCGSTGGVAEAIGETLRRAGAPVDVRLIGDVNDLGPYRSVVVGSAVRMGRWLPEAVDFVEKHRDRLGRVPTAYFVVCASMKEDTPENRGKVFAYLDPVRKGAPQIHTANTGLFAGAVDFSKLSFIYRSALKAKGSTEGDFRNWGAIKTWAGDVAPALLGA